MKNMRFFLKKLICAILVLSAVSSVHATLYYVSANATVYCASGSFIISYMGGDGLLRTRTVIAGQSINPLLDPITGKPVPVAGDGYLAILQPPVIINLILANPNTSVASQFTKNGTTFYIDPR